MKRFYLIIIVVVIFCVVVTVGLVHAVKLRSIYHCEHYNHVRNKINNPKTENNIFPDTLIWSKGGQEKYGLKLFIHCEKPNRIYKSGDLVGIRSGILNCSNKDQYLAVAHYSPDKSGVPPEYTLYLDGPEAAKKYEYGILYMGDDCIDIAKRTKANLIKIAPEEMFNPSPDSLYYNTWNGILRCKDSGVYKIWCLYSFDSLTSSIAVEKLEYLVSDTIEIIVKWDPCGGCLF